MTAPTKVCSIDGCDATVVGRGWCKKHYNRWHRHGDPHIVHPPWQANPDANRHRIPCTRCGRQVNTVQDGPITCRDCDEGTGPGHWVRHGPILRFHPAEPTTTERRNAA